MSDAETVLRNELGKMSAKRGYKAYDMDITAIDASDFSSELFKVSLSPHQQAPIKLFAKVGVILNTEDKKAGEILYVTEKYVYEDLIPEFVKIQEKHGISADHRLVTPELFDFSSNGGRHIVVLEDLSSNGFESFNSLEGFTWEYASKSVEQLARLHALSFAWQLEKPEEFEKMKSKLRFNLDLFESVRSLYRGMIANSPLLVKDEFKEKLKSVVESQDLVQLWLDTSKPHDYPLLVHGDYRGSNIMHRIKDGKLDIMPVDYQTLYVGCPVSDLMYFIYTSSDEDFRRLHYRKLVEHYYKELSNMLKRLHLDVDQVYPREAFDNDLSRLKMQGLTIALTVLGFFLVDKDSALQVGGDIEDFKFRPSRVYLDRLNGIVSDYETWGLL